MPFSRKVGDPRESLGELEPTLRDRLLPLDEPVARDDWEDVVRRSRAFRFSAGPSQAATRGVTLIVALAAALLLLVPRNDLGSSGSGGSRLAAPSSSRSTAPARPVVRNAISAKPHLVTSTRLPDGSHALYVSSAGVDGYCYRWTGTADDCASRAAPLGVSWGRGRIVGAVSSGRVSSVKVRFTDGTSAEPEIVWVSKPIDAGFFLYGIPAGKTVEEVIAKSGHGRTQGRVPWYSV